MGTFHDHISTPDNFVVTLELVPGRESRGRSIDTITAISKEAQEDGRISAVSITDNPGGNPALSPDALGREILDFGMDVIVHFTCRDTNRMGMESRALQLSLMGMHNILALTGDYSGKGFGGRGTPVFDFDSVILTSMLGDLNKRLIKTGHSEIFIIGCAVSPFKYTESESWIQYKKLEKKAEAGASFTITQLGYDVDKYEELLHFKKDRNLSMPAIASLYMLDKRAANAMHRGRVPGVFVPDKLQQSIAKEWQDATTGKKASIERTARLGAVLKGIGYNGIHLGGVHDNFDTVGQILDRMEAIGPHWQDHLDEFRESADAKRFYLYPRDPDITEAIPKDSAISVNLTDTCHYLFLKKAHDLFFDKEATLAPMYHRISNALEKNNAAWVLKCFLEDPFKKIMLRCRGCGDCGIQHVGFLCPESGCPKHTRNGACGGSRNGQCEVNPDKLCVWVRAYRRMRKYGEEDKLNQEMVPPRLWELKDTSSWINFHLDRDHQRDPVRAKALADKKTGKS